MRRFCLLLLVCVAAPAAGQPATLGAWERLGDAKRRIYSLAFAPQAGNPAGEPVVWAGGTNLWRLDPSPGGGPGTWVEVRHLQGAQDLLLLPAGAAEPDTILVVDGSVRRSLDGGATFVPVLEASGYDLTEAPQGSPHAGALFAALGAGGVAVSPDRGATWVEATPFPHMLGTDAVIPLRSGRIVAGGVCGVALSDDGGHTFVESPTLYEHLRYGVRYLTALGGAGLNGVERVVAVVGENGVQGETVRVSDDEGATWRVAWSTPVGTGGARKLVPLPGADASAPVRSALLVMSLGAVYRTDDGGETWGPVGEVPCVAEDTAGATAPHVAAVGPDGRLYVGCVRAGNQEPWSYRTAEPVFVASEASPEAPGGLALSAVPNPSAGAVALALVLPAAGAVRVVLYDSLGRAVAVVHEGALAAGRHRLAVDAGRLSPGVYVARVVTEAGVAVARLVVAP